MQVACAIVEMPKFCRENTVHFWRGTCHPPVMDMIQLGKCLIIDFDLQGQRRRGLALDDALRSLIILV